jgi:hypothetical protein
VYTASQDPNACADNNGTNEGARNVMGETMETIGRRFAKDMRENLGIGTNTPRRRSGLDLHAEILECVRNATWYPGYYGETRTELFRKAYGAVLSYDKHIAGYRASGDVISHINNLSPYQFSALIGRMVDAGITNVGEGEQFFYAMARDLHAQTS